ncbi:MAG: NAD-dependent epimerase/dehydratase family protein [Rhizobiaceae bacterium]
MTKVLVTGATGYIAKHIVLQLLQSGYEVCGSVRTLSRGQEIIDAVEPHLDSDFEIDKFLTFVELDLTADAGWQEAMDGIDVLMHTASPFPLDAPKTEDELIRPAVDGTLRALRAAAATGIKRVVLTASTACVLYRELPEDGAAFDENHWTDVDHKTCTPYSKSKTLAEMAAWKFVETEAPDIQLTAINPGFVIGAPLDNNFGTSMKSIARLLSGKDPALPQVGFFSVDVRDVAVAHVGTIDNLDTHGLRILVVERFMWFADIAQAIADAFPDRKIVTRLAPNWLIRLLGLFDQQIRSITPMLGQKLDVSNARAKELLAIDFADTRKSAQDSARYLIDNKLV